MYNPILDALKVVVGIAGKVLSLIRNPLRETSLDLIQKLTPNIYKWSVETMVRTKSKHASPTPAPAPDYTVKTYAYAPARTVNDVFVKYLPQQPAFADDKFFRIVGRPRSTTPYSQRTHVTKQSRTIVDGSSYYFLSMLGVTKVSCIKRYITQLQLLQFSTYLGGESYPLHGSARYTDGVSRGFVLDRGCV
ncbi:hypothetical protein HDU93_004683 [Gonapodya sp. JEL0774]|nr:hypothetical protein HDU93_004683 [Gonapodya sp. JEL0774]